MTRRVLIATLVMLCCAARSGADTPTETPLPTATPTPLNCAIRGQTSCRIPQNYAPIGDAAGNKATFQFFGPPSVDDDAEAAITPVEGMMIYNSTDDKFRGYADGAWRDFH